MSVDKPPPSPNVAHLLLGANLGERAATLAEARRRLVTAPTDELLAVSALYETAPWGGAVVAGQPPYLNQAVALRTLLDPFALINRLLAVEGALGRTRDQPWQARTIDIDLLLFGGFQIDFAPLLELPHPRLAERRFALVPLAEIAPAQVVPGTGGRTVAQLLAACADPLDVRRVK